MKDEEMAGEYANDMAMYYESAHGSIPSQFEKYLKKAYLAGLKAGRPRWHDLQKDPNDLPNGTVNLDMYPDFMKSKIKPRIRVAAKIFFKGYAKTKPWEDILYYEDGKWLELHQVQGKCKFFKEIPNCEYVLAWYEIPTFEKE